MYWGDLGRKKQEKEKEEDWQQLLVEVPIFKEKKKRNSTVWTKSPHQDHEIRK